MSTTPILFPCFAMLYTCNSFVLLDLLTCALDFRGVGFKQCAVILLWTLPFRWQYYEHSMLTERVQSMSLFLYSQHQPLNPNTGQCVIHHTTRWHHPVTMKTPQFEWTNNRHWIFPMYSWIFPCYNIIFLEYLPILGNSLQCRAMRLQRTANKAMHMSCSV